MDNTVPSELEAEAIEIIREVAATAAKPVMLYSKKTMRFLRRR